MNNEFKLKDLKILQNLNGNTFKQLTPQYQAKIEDYQFLAYTIQYPTHEKVKFDIFDRVNRGGTQLNNQEMRNALYLGKTTELLNHLVKSQNFLLATGKTISPKRMKDKYIVLRFLGFYLLRSGQLEKIEYKSDIDEFLAEVMRFINKMTDKQIDDLEFIFELAMKNSFSILGKDGFRFCGEKKRRPVNMGLFECISYMLSVLLPKQLDFEPSVLKEKIDELKKEMDSSQMFLGVIDSNIGVEYRLNKADEIRMELLNAQ